MKNTEVLLLGLFIVTVRPLPVSLQFDYYNSMLINTVDDDGNSVELGGEFLLEENEHFNNMPVNTQMSDIQVPTNVYNKGQRSSTTTNINMSFLAGV